MILLKDQVNMSYHCKTFYNIFNLLFFQSVSKERLAEKSSFSNATITALSRRITLLKKLRYTTRTFLNYDVTF